MGEHLRDYGLTVGLHELNGDGRMRWLVSLGSICVLLTLASCSGPSEYPELVERDGLSFQRRDSIPYTGSTITLHKNGQVSDKKTYAGGMLHGSQCQQSRASRRTVKRGHTRS